MNLSLLSPYPVIKLPCAISVKTPFKSLPGQGREAAGSWRGSGLYGTLIRWRLIRTGISLPLPSALMMRMILRVSVFLTCRAMKHQEQDPLPGNPLNHAEGLRWARTGYLLQEAMGWAWQACMMHQAICCGMPEIRPCGR